MERDCLNVLYIASEPRIDMSRSIGHTTHIRNAIAGLRQAGHRVDTLIAGDRGAARSAKATFQKAKPWLPASARVLMRDVYAMLHDRRWYRHCSAHCRGVRYDFIYERATPYHETGLRLARSLGIPLILEVNSPLEEMITFHGCSRWLLPTAERCEARVAAGADAVIVGSRAMGDYLHHRGVHRDRIFTIYPATHDQAFRPSTRREQLREHYNIADKIVVGFVGSMAEFHRVDLLLKAAAKLRLTAPRIHVLLVGDGKLTGDLRRLASGLNLDQSVTFTGRVPYDDVHEYCAAMDICVIADVTWYGMPTKLFDYAASARPVVAPRAGPIGEMIRDGENGMLFTKEDVDDLAQRIVALMSDPDLRRRLGESLREDTRRIYTWEENTRRLIDIVDSITRPTET